MTSTKQDKELRELLYTLLKTDPRADTYVIPYRVMDIFVDFITADRKRVELEARIDEVNQLYNEHLRRWDDDECDIYKNRIAELKAQQEEV